MEHMLLDTIALYSKVATITFGLVGCLNAFLAYYLGKERIFDVDALMASPETLLGKSVKVEGNTSGDTFKRFIGNDHVLYSVYKETYMGVNVRQNVKAKTDTIWIEGKSTKVPVYLDSNTQILTTPAYYSKSYESLGWKDSLKSMIHMILGFFSSEIFYSMKRMIVKTEHILKSGSFVTIKGVLTKYGNAYGIKPESLRFGKDADLIKGWRRLSVSAKLFTISGLIWIGTILYKKARNRQIKLFSREKKEESEVGLTEECIICLTYPRNMLMNPCKHMAVCSRCTDLSQCPICRTPIQYFTRLVFFN